MSDTSALLPGTAFAYRDATTGDIFSKVHPSDDSYEAWSRVGGGWPSVRPTSVEGFQPVINVETEYQLISAEFDPVDLSDTDPVPYFFVRQGDLLKIYCALLVYSESVDCHVFSRRDDGSYRDLDIDNFSREGLTVVPVQVKYIRKVTLGSGEVITETIELGGPDDLV